MPDIQRYQPAAACTRRQLVPYMRQDDRGEYIKLADHQQAVKSLRLSNQAVLEVLEKFVDTFQLIDKQNHDRPLPIDRQPPLVVKAMKEITNAKQLESLTCQE